MDRVVVYGCSHAFGAEIEGPGIGISKTNAEKNFGALVARHFDKPLKISARLGGSNRQILFDVIEHAQAGDLCLLSWTYFGRDNWFPRSNDDLIKAEIFNEYHVTEAFYLSENPREATSDRLKSGGCQLIANYNDSLVKSFSHTQMEYYQILMLISLQLVTDQ